MSCHAMPFHVYPWSYIYVAGPMSVVRSVAVQSALSRSSFVFNTFHGVPKPMGTNDPVVYWWQGVEVVVPTVTVTLCVALPPEPVQERV